MWKKSQYGSINPTRKELEKGFKSLPRSGTVKVDSKGAIYLDLDNDWIFRAVGAVGKYGYGIPRSLRGKGAHVKIVEDFEMEASVRTESVLRSLIGTKVDFEIICFYSALEILYECEILDYVIKVQIKSDQLSEIRETLTFQKTPPNGKFFYVVLAVKDAK